MDTQEILDLQEAYLNVYSSHELDEEEADRLRDRRAEAGAHWGGGNDPAPRRPSSGSSKPQTAAERAAAAKKHKETSDAAFASVVADLKKKYGDNAVISGMRTRKPGGSVSEASQIADRAKRALDNQRGGFHGDDHAMNQAQQGLSASMERLRKAPTSYVSRSTANRAAKEAERKVRSGEAKFEQYDLYDIVLSHLLDEGYADTIDSAEVIMDNMSEEWVDEIISEVTGFGGHIDPTTGNLTGRISGAQRRRTAWRESGLKTDTRRSKHGTENTYKTATAPDHAGLHHGSSNWKAQNQPNLSMTPAKRAELAAKRAERQGEGKRANKIRARISGAIGDK